MPKDKIKDRNSRDPVNTGEIKKRWIEYTELYKKALNEPDYCDGVVSHLEPDILVCEVKWALGSTAVNKANECNGLPVELFRTLTDDATKVLHSIRQQIWKTQQWPQGRKKSILIPPPKKGSTKECANHQTVEFISLASKVMLKILHARLQHYMNQELADAQDGFRKGKGTRDQITCWIIKIGNSPKNLPLFYQLC